MKRIWPPPPPSSEPIENLTYSQTDPSTLIEQNKELRLGLMRVSVKVASSESGVCWRFKGKGGGMTEGGNI